MKGIECVLCVLFGPKEVVNDRKKINPQGRGYDFVLSSVFSALYGQVFMAEFNTEIKNFHHCQGASP